jgi:hypothetical protein
MLRRRAATALLLGIFIAACKEAPVDLGPVRCILGTGVTRFTPLVDGSPIRIARGPQGGAHLWGAVLIRGLDPNEVQLAYRFVDAETGQLLNEVVEQVALSPLAEALIGPPVVPECPTSGLPETAPLSPGGGSEAPQEALPTGVEGWTMALASTVYIPNSERAEYPAFVGHRIRMSVVATDVDGRSCHSARVVLPCH